MPSTCRLELSKDFSGVQRARQVTAEQLQTWGCGSLIDDAELLVSELATNALLHADEPIELVLQPITGGVRVEVRDGSRHLPLPAAGSAEAMTGRGLRLVKTLASDWGVERLPQGKAVWVELAERSALRTVELDQDELLRLWGEDESEARGQGLIRVALEDVPTGLLAAAKTHVDNLVREFALAAAGARTGATAPPSPGLVQALETAVTEFADARLALKQQAHAAQQQELPTVTLVLELPPEAADAAERYLDALERVDTYCRDAQLLTLATPPEQRAFREWYVCELIDQLRRVDAGLPPQPTEPFSERLRRALDS